MRWIVDLWRDRIPMTADRWWEMFVSCTTAVVLAFMLVMLTGFTLAALGQELHVHKDGTTYEGKLGEFYATWKTLPLRVGSCCNENDCAPVTLYRKDGHWWAVGHKLHPEPVLIPDAKIEQNATSQIPRESPDGRSHACLTANEYGVIVYCAVLGSGG